MTLGITAAGVGAAALAGGTVYNIGAGEGWWGGGGGGGGGGYGVPGMDPKLAERLTQIFDTPLEWPRARKVIPGLDPMQERALEQAGLVQETGGASGPARNRAVAMGLSGAPSYVYDPAASIELFNRSVREPTYRGVREDAMPLLMEGMAGATRGGDAMRERARLLGNVEAGLAGQLGDWQRADILQGRQLAENALGRQQAAIPVSMGAEMFQPNVGLQAGAIRRGVRQQRGAYRLAKSLGSHPAYNPGMQVLPHLTGAGLVGGR